jgi:hypothetical protein
MVVPLKSNEVVVRAGDSTYFAETEKVNGKLILTNQRIYFRTFNGHGDRFDLEIMPPEIKEVIFFNTMKILPNGLNIILKDGKELRFTVKNRNEIGVIINKMY